MEEDPTSNNKVENVIVCHVEDSVTFWARDINSKDDILKTCCVLAEICPQANPVFGNPDLTKIYGGCFSEDKCWYRCKILKVINDEKCQVLYVDYGNSEMLSRSEIVEIPVHLQFPCIAKRFMLWDLQIAVTQNLNLFDQGRKFLSSLIFEKEMKIRCKAVCSDGTTLVQAECGLLDVGEEVAKQGFAERCRSSIKNNGPDIKTDSLSHESRNAKNSPPQWVPKGSPPAISRPKAGFGDHMLPLNGRSESNLANHGPLIREKMAAVNVRRMHNASLGKNKQEQEIIAENVKLKLENECLKKENQNLLHQREELELKVQKLTHDLQEERKGKQEILVYLDSTLPVYIGTTTRNLATKFKKLKEARYIVYFCSAFALQWEIFDVGIHIKQKNLSEAVKVVTGGCLAAPFFLEKLEKAWMDYNTLQEEIRFCKDVEKVQYLIINRNEVQQKLNSTIEEFIVEVNGLPISEHLEALQKLQGSLETVYGEVPEAESSEGAYDKFFEWKNVKLQEFNQVKNATDMSLQNLVTCFSKIIQCFDMNSDTFLNPEEVIGDVDEVLKNSELTISQELDIFLTEPDDAERKIILNAYSEVMQKIQQEQQLLSTVRQKYLDSVEFKKQVVEWLGRSPNIDDLLLIKKRMKNKKANLRLKMVERNNLEESDDYSELEVAKINKEIVELRNEVFQEVYKEQDEYEKLNHLVQKWFPELPLLHPKAGIQRYMNSRGLLTVNLERDLLDAEPMKELSTKRPVICSEVRGQKILLKGYPVDMNTETEVIERAAQYHRVWRELKEESGLLQLMFLFLCKSDPVAYLMVPYYAGASLAILQTTLPLTPEETCKVMKGIARGLYSLHTAGIVHGSLHNKNVFAINREQGIVGDFDFTKSEGQRASLNLVELNGLSLTPPEVKQGQPPSPASDMYAFGCLLYWLLIGNQEFKINSDGTPEIDELIMDGKAKSLLMNLLCSNTRMTSGQVLSDGYFLLPSVVPVPLKEEQAECGNGGERLEGEMVPDVRRDEEPALLETTEPDECVQNAKPT
ncbi:hypothetical protein JRQ81_018702 [Phrynocephalus forsythii]|uniref:Serine/threonine-protein kinase 31 n=1 Tax=Phrynocephalus forsythii TaxID=171643 RepID=A0A9Q1AZC4_9SAUR|nr:hypothetical protein JRQ81_018702 [Phrynocephalus forsythii]